MTEPTAYLVLAIAGILMAIYLIASGIALLATP